MGGCLTGQDLLVSIRNKREATMFDLDHTSTGDEVRVYGALSRVSSPTAQNISEFLGDVDADTVEAICLDRGWSLAK